MKFLSKQGRVYSATIAILTGIIAANISLGADKVAAPVDIVYGNTMPGLASAKQKDGKYILSNNVLSVEWSLENGRLMLTGISDVLQTKAYPQSTELFEFQMDDLQHIRASECVLIGTPIVESLKSTAVATNTGGRLKGKQISAVFKHEGTGVMIRWRAELRDGSHYFRQMLNVEGSKGRLTSVTCLRASAGKTWLEGSAQAGNPVCSDHLFMGQELPMSQNVPSGVVGADASHWSQDDMQRRFIGRTLKDLKPGPLAVTIAYESGADRIDMDQVQIRHGGKVVSKDVHPGWSSSTSEANTYSLTVPDGVTTADLDVILGGRPEYRSNGKITVNNGVLGGEPSWPVRCMVNCQLQLQPGKVYEFSSVLGTYPEGQLRRAFLRYLERERARPYKPFLHYNCWFDLERGVNEKDMLSRISSFTEEMTVKRGVAVQSYVLDDGWDDLNAGFWAINKTKFPAGFDKLATELERVHSHLGIWISPLAGYDGNEQRVAQARKLGLVSGEWLDLSDAKYYTWFRDYCANLVTKNKVNYFKWDKAGGGVSPHFMALLACARELRQINPDLFLNVTVGTWPSPFWLNVVDCTWREGNDMGWEGKGDDREMWLNYRDAQTYRFVVKRGPLYPLNSIMNHGIVMAKGHFFAARAAKAGNDLRHEARSFFGSGTALQELYIQPDLMATSSWDAVASAAKWAKLNADVLVDTHWVGGNPEKQEIYGWASWSAKKAILTLRNPDDQPQEIKLDAGVVFDLPAGAAKDFTMTSPYADQRVQKVEMTAGKPTVFALQPFEVLVLESKPTTAK